MIDPLKATANSYQSNPIALNPQRAYRETANYRPMGEKLNINCNDNRLVRKSNGVGVNLDIMA